MPAAETDPDLAKNRVILKKKHPCGSNEFGIVHGGMEVVLKCMKCGSFVRMAKDKFERSKK